MVGVTVNIKFVVTEFITSFTNKTFVSLFIFFLYYGVAKKKNLTYAFLIKLIECCRHNSSKTEQNFLQELTYKHSRLPRCLCRLKGKHAGIPSVSLFLALCKMARLLKTK